MRVWACVLAVSNNDFACPPSFVFLVLVQKVSPYAESLKSFLETFLTSTLNEKDILVHSVRKKYFDLHVIQFFSTRDFRIWAIVTSCELIRKNVNTNQCRLYLIYKNHEKIVFCHFFYLSEILTSLHLDLITAAFFYFLDENKKDLSSHLDFSP